MITLVLIYIAYIKGIKTLQSVGLPLAAILFTIGTLWHKKEDQEFEKQKHANEMNLAFRQIRWGYYSLLKNEVVAIILYGLSPEDVIPNRSIESKDTKYGKLHNNLVNLEDEGTILFNASISKKIILIRGMMEEKADLLRKIYLSHHEPIDLVPRDPLKDRMQLSAEIHEVDSDLDILFKGCKKEIFSFLMLPIAP